MAWGTHWEWRGFGSITEVFFGHYKQLIYEFGPLEVDDLYLWAPGLQLNLKIRQGGYEGLKIKRPCGKEGRFECWSEHPNDLFDFPLEKDAWHSLAVGLAGAGLVLGPYPEEAPGQDDLLFILEGAGCESLLVSKERGGRWWPGPNGRVFVEWTALHKPQSIFSISLESEDTNRGDAGLTNDQAKTDLRAAIEAFDLERELLTPMNYLDAVATWVNGGLVKK